MRDNLYRNKMHDDRIQYRGKEPSRLDNLTDGVFGIAITLLIFNLANPNSFGDLLTFTKTLPAFLISIAFLVLVWNEHLRFSEIYALNDGILTLLNTLFVALIIFYVYPLRFLTLYLTNFFFHTDIQVSIQGDQVSFLMIYYGCAAFAIYFTLFLFYQRALKIKASLQLNDFEVMYTRFQKIRLCIMFLVPLISIFLTTIIHPYSYIYAAVAGGMTYCLYSPAIFIWYRKYKKASSAYV
jgi:uncharacterized membrane protein